MNTSGPSALLEGAAKLGVCCDSPGDQDSRSTGLAGCRKGAVAEVADDSILKFADEAKRLLGAERKELLKFAVAACESGFPGGDFGGIFGMFPDVIEDGGLQPAETEIQRIPFHLDVPKFHRGHGGTSGGGESIEDGTAGITQSEEFGDFVVGVAGSVVARLANFAIAQLCRGFGASSLLLILSRVDFIEHGVAARDNQANCREVRDLSGLVRFEEDSMDVTLKMIHRNERLIERMCESLAIGNADEERANEAGTLRNANRVKIGEGQPRLEKSLPDDGHDLAEVFARGKFGHDAAVFAVNINLRGDDAGKNFAAVRDDGGSGFIARRFNTENANGHGFMLTQGYLVACAATACPDRTMASESD